MKYLLVFTIFSTVIWEVFRLPIITSNGISLTDLLAWITIFFWFFNTLLFKRDLKIFKGFFALFWFLFVCFFSLIWNIWEMWLDFWESLNSWFYLIRYFIFAFLTLIAFNLDKKDKKFVLNWIFFTSFIIFIFWIIQLKLFPDFDKLRMVNSWWDPHKWRLLSTRFDPNFLWWYFALISSILVWKIWQDFKENKKINYVLLFLVLCLIFWIILTFSRSALLALIISFSIIWVFISRKFLIISTIILILWLWISDRAQERFFNWVESAKAMFLWIWNIDPTAKLRVDSWKTWIAIFEDNPVIWIWFNTLKIEQKKRWAFIWEKHWASGIDSSIITIMATTWTIWLLFFLSFLTQICRNFLKNFLKEKNFLAMGAFAGIWGLFVHSIFVNSLFFYLILPSLFIWIWVILREK